MNKIYRENTNINVAFSSGINCLRSKDLSIQKALVEIRSADSANEFLPKLLFHLVYRLIRFFLGPIALRARHYFTEGLNHQEDLEKIQGLLCTTLQEIRSVEESLKTEVQQVLHQTHAQKNSCPLTREKTTL